MTNTKQNILVGVDGSEQSARALEFAVEMAVRLQASLHVVRAEEFPLVVATPGGDALPVALVSMVDRFNEEVLRTRNECADLIDRIIDDRAEASLHIVRGRPIESLLAAINTWKPVLVVVGSHGRGAIKSLLLGSVSTQLCRRSPAPVLVVPPLEQAQRERPSVVVPTRELAGEEAIVPAPAMASSCVDCGHILNEQTEPRTRCAGCGREPAHWFSAPLTT